MENLPAMGCKLKATSKKRPFIFAVMSLILACFYFTLMILLAYGMHNVRTKYLPLMTSSVKKLWQITI